MPKDTAAPAVTLAEVRFETVIGETDVTGTPEEHAKTEKQFIGRVDRYARVNNEPASFDLFTWQHNAAAALHGWADHAHHAAAPIQITAKAYRNALRAAAEPDAVGNYLPHPAALSPHCPHTRKS